MKEGIEVTGAERDIHFIVEVYGLSITGTSRGIAYLHNQPDKNLTTNLQAVIASPKDSGTFYEHLTNNWYIFYDIER